MAYLGNSDTGSSQEAAVSAVETAPLWAFHSRAHSCWEIRQPQVPAGYWSHTLILSRGSLRSINHNRIACFLRSMTSGRGDGTVERY